MTIRAILFDKDGTLLDFDATFGPAGWLILSDLAEGDPVRFEALAEIAGYDRETRRFARDASFVADPTHVYGRAWAEVLGRDCNEDFLDLIDSLTTRHAMTSLTVFDDVAATLSALAGQGYPLGIATNDTEASAREQIAALALNDFFPFIAGYDSGHGAKPGPGMVEAFAAHNCIAVAEVAMVGDSLNDLNAARAAGARAIAVATGLTPVEVLAPRADHVIDRLSAVLDLLG